MTVPAQPAGVWESRAALCGIAFVLLFVLGLVLGAAGSVDLDGAAAEVDTSYNDNQNLLLASERTGVLAVFFLLAFTVALGGALRRAEGPGGWLGGAAVAGGAASAVLLLAVVGFGGIAVHEGVCAHDPSAAGCSGAEDSLDPGTFSILDALAFEFMVLAAIPFAILLAATSIVVRRTKLLPRWLGTAAGVLAMLFPIATIVKFAALVLYVPFLAWIVAVSVALARLAPAKFPARS